MKTKIEQGYRRQTYQLAEKVRNTPIRNIGNEREEKESPGHWIQKGFFDLIPLEVFVTDTLLVDSHASNRPNTIFLGQPTGIQLAVWDNPKEKKAQGNSEQSCEKENNLPRFNSRSVFCGSNRDAVGDETTQNLAPAIEAIPEIDSFPLLIAGIPL